MAGRASRVVSALAVLAFCWYVQHMVRVALQLFYPAKHIPLIKPLPAAPPGTPMHRLAWREPFEYEASVYVSPLDSFLDDGFFNSSTLVWRLGPQSSSQQRPHFDIRLRVSIPEPMRTANVTALYAFLFVQKAGLLAPHPDLRDPLIAYARAELVSARPRRIDRKHSLVDGRSPADRPRADEVQGDYSTGPWVPHGKTRLSWEIVLEDNQFPEWTMPLDIAPHLRIIRTKAPRGRPYIPLIWENPLAARDKHWTPLTTRTSVSEEVPLELASIEIDASLRGVGLGWFRLCNYVYHGLQELRSPRSLIQYSDTDVDNLKEMVHEVNPTMLAITMAAMAFHLLFELLAYKEDVAFWSSKSKSSTLGISRSSMLMGVASSWIRLLYMWDRRSETNVVVLFGAGAGALVEAWKLTRVLRIDDLLPWGRKLFRRSPTREGPAAKRKSKALAKTGPEAKPAVEDSQRERVQREVDQQTAWYITRVCAPLMVAYAAFSLVYQQHDSHMSWLLNISLVTVYSLEFVGMWPQLLINHKLKTVDMLPLTAFLYRFLLTFIDDLYALVVPMPLLERIGTLRDDVVFVVLCYQWLKFPRRKATESAVDDAARDTSKGTRTSKSDSIASKSRPL
ncbi:Cleft lip and palate associated transmembrane protein 1 [Coemansia biformis]|uniref:Cleft lip and palate associated transmembrane protein 1 n=1 Tax=Coemansia biformis TaxID=1286918 RepID=A0A9W8D1Z4_9FUNG|nr:Cleft lip and palate associated transmembrane protein 1 [Coemansia biformis]